MILTDPVSLLCDLIEARVGSFDADALRSEAAQTVEFLLKIGALMPGQMTRGLTCRACHEDHPVHLEFDSGTRRHWHFCPEAGRVMVEDDALATICVDPEWVLDWLVTALPITPPVRRRVLIPALDWHLGDAHMGGTELAVVFAIGMCRQSNLGALASAISAAPPADFGIVLTTSAAPPRPLRLPHGYEFLELRGIASPEKDSVASPGARSSGCEDYCAPLEDEQGQKRLKTPLAARQLPPWSVSGYCLRRVQLQRCANSGP
jgi:hypothetical protein